VKTHPKLFALYLFIFLFLLSACSPSAGSPSLSPTPVVTEPTPTSPEDYVLIVGDTPAPQTLTGEPTQEEAVLAENLTMQTDSETIRLRLLRNYTRWDTLQVDGVVKYFNPGESETAAQTIRTQIWIDQKTGRYRVLLGNQPDTVEQAIICDGASILDLNLVSQTSEVYSVAPYVKEYYNPPEIVTDMIEPHPLEGSLGTPMAAMIFSSGIAQRGGYYQPIRSETFAGRETIVVDWYRMQGMLVDRFWIDSESGMILRWQNFGKGGGEAVETEMIINRFEFGAPMPDELFNLQEVGTPEFTD